MAGFHLAQFNVATGLGVPEDPVMAGFMARLDEINGLAETSPGFVWRLQTASGNATAVRPYDDDRVLVNLSVWESIDTFRSFVYRSAHGTMVRRGGEWFLAKQAPQLVMWWLDAGTLPTIEDGVEHLAELRAAGPSAAAFTFARPYPPP